MVVLNELNLATRCAQFYCDKESELADLPNVKFKGKNKISAISPVSPGSFCLCGETGNLFYLNGDSNSWELFGGE